MNLLLTGAAGFIGSALCRYLLTHTPYRIVGLDAHTYAASPESLTGLASERFTLVEGNIADEALVAEIFAGLQPDAVLHLAAETHVDRSIDDPGAFVMTNVVGTEILLAAARRHYGKLSQRSAGKDFRFLHVSTDEVFGSLGDHGAFTVTDAYRPSSPYAASKAAADHLVRAYGKTYGLPVVICHPTNTYGPWQFPEKLIPTLVGKALRGEVLPLYGNGMQQREWLYVDDLAAGLAAALTHGKPQESYAFGSGDGRTNLAVAHAVCDALQRLLPSRDYRALIQFVEDRPGHDYRYALESHATRGALSWSPQTGFSEGIEKTVAWYTAHSEWMQTKFDGKRLGRGQKAGQAA